MIKRIILSIIAIAMLLGSTPVFTQVAYAACPSSNTPKGQVIDGIKESGDDCSGSGVTDFVGTVVKILSRVVGIAAIIMIVIAGFKYITSSGDTAKVASAKNTLIYALVGVIVAVLAQLLVNFAFTTSSSASLSCPSGQHASASGAKCIPN